MKILVTGGSSDIGAAIAARRLQKGDEVTITASSDEGLKKTLEQYAKNGVRARGLVFNLASPSDSEAALAKTLPEGVDALVLNACSRVIKMRRLHEIAEKDTRAYIDANIYGNLWLLHRLLPKMVERKFGRCVFISSVSALGAEKYGAYCLAKAAVEGLFLNLAIDYGSDNVLCNILRPGVIQTSRTKRFWRSEKYVATASRLIPQGKLGQPEQIAEALDPLLSENSYINGSALNVSGGLPLFRYPSAGASD